jgi:hypothetical protein
VIGWQFVEALATDHGHSVRSVNETWLKGNTNRFRRAFRSNVGVALAATTRLVSYSCWVLI